MLQDARYLAIPTLVGSGTTTLTGDTVDTLGALGLSFHAEIKGTLVAQTGVLTLEVSEDGNTWVAAQKHEVVGAEDGDLSIEANVDATQVALSYSGIKRYVRPVLTITGTLTGANVIANRITNFAPAGLIPIPGNE